MAEVDPEPATRRPPSTATSAPTTPPATPAATVATPPPNHTPEPLTRARTPTPPPTPTQPPPRVRLAAVGDVMLGRSVGVRLEAEGPEAAFAGVRDILTGAGHRHREPGERGRRHRRPCPEGVHLPRPARGGGRARRRRHRPRLAREQPLARLRTRVPRGDAGAARRARHPRRRRGAGSRSRARPRRHRARGAHHRVPRLRRRAGRAGRLRPPHLDRDGRLARRGLARHRHHDRGDTKRPGERPTWSWSCSTSVSSGALEPSDAQREQARAAIDAGATLVVGSHPHVLQPLEPYGDGLIAYSLGNFVFDGFWDPANDSAILLVELTAAGVAAYELVPVTIVDGLPVLAGPDESAP